MPRLVNRLPAYKLHKASGQAVVCLAGERIYLGRFGTAASRKEYDRVCASWVAAGRTRAAGSPAAAPFSVLKLVAAYRRHARAYYKSDGELGAIKSVCRILLAGHADTPAAEFDVMALRVVRDRMVAAGWCRKYVNNQVHRLRQMFRWAASYNLVPAAVHQALVTVEPLKRGRCKAPESRPVTEVSDPDVDAIRPHVSAQVWAMVRLQRLTGMRPGEACAMRLCDVDRSGTVWTYTPASHKTEHHGHERHVFVGPQAQGVLDEWIRRREERRELTAHLFQPAEAEAARLAALHEERKRNGTPLHHGNAPGTNRRRRPRVTKGGTYTVASYRRAITRACEVAFGMPDALRLEPKGKESPAAKAVRLSAAAAWRSKHCWHPHQLRHSAATDIRERYDLEVTQAVLGHATMSATQVYAKRKMNAARKAMGEVG